MTISGPSPRRSGNGAPHVNAADAALLGWLGYAATIAGFGDPAVDRFIRRGEHLCTAGYATREMTLELWEWRRLATRGVLLFGRAFDAGNQMRVWGPHQAAKRRDTGRRLYADGAFAPPHAPSRAAVPSWQGWEREVAGWEQDQSGRREQAQTRLAAERMRLRLESVWARPAPGRSPRAAA